MRVTSHIFHAIVVATALLAAGLGTASAQDSFYQPSAQDLAGDPGTLIREQKFLLGPENANAYRILYRSTGLNGEPIAVSGMAIIPDAAAPEGGRRIIAWAHPTSGVVPKCAPSVATFGLDQIQGLAQMVKEGYIVVATDYPGLGVANPTHPYLVGVSEGRAVLDSVRAVAGLPDASASNEFALWGHSQGGQAVLYAADLAAKYTPSLKLVGAAAAAPATDLEQLMKDDIDTSGGKNLLAMTLWSWNKVFDARLGDVVEPDAIQTIDQLADVCIESIIDLIPRMADGAKLAKSFLKTEDITTVEPWNTLMKQNTIGTLPPSVPVFIAQGTTDVVVDPPVTEAYVKSLCAAGSPVVLKTYPNVGHLEIAKDAALDAIAWIDARFAGEAAPKTC